MNSVWVFNGNNGNFPSGVFSNQEKAEEFIVKHKLSGVLIEYPIDTSVYDWAIAQGWFTPKSSQHFRIHWTFFVGPSETFSL